VNEEGEEKALFEVQMESLANMINRKSNNGCANRTSDQHPRDEAESFAMHIVSWDKSDNKRSESETTVLVRITGTTMRRLYCIWTDNGGKFDRNFKSNAYCGNFNR
jgi:hypothetical protein